MKTTTYAGHGVAAEEAVTGLRRHPDRSVLPLVALHACWGPAIPAIKLMVATVPPVGGAALIFVLAGSCSLVPRAGVPGPRARSCGTWQPPACCCWRAGKDSPR
jgi:hypothetical protein